MVAVMGPANVVQALALAGRLVVNCNWYERPTSEVQLSGADGYDPSYAGLVQGIDRVVKVCASSLQTEDGVRLATSIDSTSEFLVSICTARFLLAAVSARWNDDSAFPSSPIDL